MLRFVVHAQNLLPDCVRPTRQKTCLSRSRPILHANDSRDVDLLGSKIGDQRIPRGVRAHGSDWQHARAQVGEIVGRVRGPTRNDLGFMVAQNQHRRFPGDPRDFAELKFVGNKVTEKHNRLRRESFNPFGKCEEVNRIRR